MNKTLHDFIEAINSAEVDKLYDLMAEDHLFIDSQGNKSIGKDFMKRGWTHYFSMFPDYTIETEKIIEEGAHYYFFGYASGTYLGKKNDTNSNFWRVPAAWKAFIRDNKLQEWQVYADNSIVIDIINRNR